ncbi:MAG: hypothetical protein KDD66_04100 [Bdellovibrionales bacterium]|nr:hypothetical protein [Bdellovibrionales bacterium]
MGGYFDYLKFCFGIGVLFVVGSGLVPSDKLPDNAPDGAVFFAEFEGGDLTLYEDALVMEKGEDYVELKLDDLKSKRRSITRVRIQSNDGKVLELNFLSLLQAKAFEEKLDQLI